MTDIISFGPDRHRRRWPAARAMWLAIALALAACDGAPQAPAETPAATSTCPPTADFGEGGMPERQGAGAGATLWALFFPTEPSLVAGKEIKIAWRMTGSGELSIRATGPDGAAVKPVWGPEPHDGSTWNRPGDEWGTGWVFPTAGCWTITAKRTSGSGSLTLRVAA